MMVIGKASSETYVLKIDKNNYYHFAKPSGLDSL